MKPVLAAFGALAGVWMFFQGGAPPPSFKNIHIADSAESTIAVSQANPNHIVAAAGFDTVRFTADGGKTWEQSRPRSKQGEDGDAVIISDQKGDFYFFHLAGGPGVPWLDNIVCQKSTDGGKTWSDGAAIGHNPPTQQDKPWAAAHPTKPTIAVTWTQFDRYGEKDPHFHSNIMFSVSGDAGATWSKAQRINEISGECLDDSGTAEGAVPAIDKLGRIYVTWSNQGVIWFQRTADNGKTWLKHDIAIAKQYGGWDMNIPGLGRCDGMPVLMVDNSPGPRNGSLYCVFADKRNGENDSDIYFIRSTDHGDTWSKPLRVNKDPAGKHQFLPWLAVDQTTGYLYVVYYDRRAYADLQTDVYLAYSTDGGITFTETKISEAPFTANAQVFIGDYINISAHRGVITPIWTRSDPRSSVWTAVIKQSELIGK